MKNDNLLAVTIAALFIAIGFAYYKTITLHEDELRIIRAKHKIELDSAFKLGQLECLNKRRRKKTMNLNTSMMMMMTRN